MHPVPTSAPLDRSAAWEHDATVLRADPGQWHTVRTCETRHKAKYIAHDIRRGRIAAFRDGHWEASNDGCDVKARYLNS
jgi:hypothetical protein